MNYNFSKIAKKLNVLVFGTICFAFLIYSGFYYLSKEIMNYYFETSSFIVNSEEPYVESLQKYISQNNMSLSDCNQLVDWIKENNITYFTISKDRELLYGVTYIDGLIMDGNATESLHNTWQYFIPVKFSDVEADVFIYATFTEKYYEILSISSALISIILGFLFIYFSIRHVIFNLQHDLELSEKREAELKKDKESIIRSMAHDLRTPLTGLITFAEIIKIENIDGKINEEHIDKVIYKANEIKELTDQIFDLSMLNNLEDISLGPKELFESALEDYLSDFCFVMEGQGFVVDSQKIEWRNINVAVNTIFLGRIINNLISNICKYGKLGTEIIIGTKYSEEFAGVYISNIIDQEKSALDSTGVGMKNVLSMMEQMGGRFLSEQEKDIFSVYLWFPIYDVKAE